MTYQAVRANLNKLFLAEDYDEFIAYWQRTVKFLSKEEQLILVRRLTAEWRHERLIKELL